MGRISSQESSVQSPSEGHYPSYAEPEEDAVDLSEADIFVPEFAGFDDIAAQEVSIHG